MGIAGDFMSDESFPAMLRNLSKAYYQNRIGFEEYRNQGKIILNKIDEEFNGHNLTYVQKDHTEDSSILMKTIAFFKNTDIDI